MNQAGFSKVSIVRQYNFLLSLYKWKVYANGKLVTKVGKGEIVTFCLTEGAYRLYLNCPDFPFPYRKRGLHSNVMYLDVEGNVNYYLSAQPHPLFWDSSHFPGINHLFKPVECLLLLKQDEHFEEHIKQLDEIGNQVTTEIKQFSYHPLTLFLAIVLGLFALVSSIWQPDLYAAGDGIPWGFLFGLSCMIGLLNGRSKQLLAQGWEHKFLVYTAIGAGFIFFFIPTGFLWQRMLYFLFVVGTLLWARACYYRWKKNKVGLDELERKEWKFEQTL